ncbi:MAG TPA: hypothetical protein VME47_16900 [Acetobacteraceae bacterium]|nr:hypothetical protein [Acetobacteraceae bacterium]
MSLSAFLSVAATVVAAGAVGNGVYEAVRGLVAKTRAHAALSSRAATDPVLRQLVLRSAGGPLSESELRQAALVIEQSLTGLSQGDRKRIEQGLHQPSKSGEQRYIEELIQSP